ncbi:MAG: hypothetical protein J7K72_02380 [Candidatus Aenigmarchaeota archaeon]|nr:hypothetical protein [Candidatus Aenigmarchaeota archaeon]
MKEENASRISFVTHTITGVLAGYLSTINQFITSISYMIVLLLVTGYATEFIVKQKKGVKWWLVNGALYYVILWLVSWVFFYNML